MGSLSKFEVLSLNVRGIRDQIKRKSIFSYLKDQKANIFYKEHIRASERAEENIWRKNGVASYFSHMAPRIVRVCVF